MMKILKAGKIAAIRTFQSTIMKVNGNRRTVLNIFWVTSLGFLSLYSVNSLENLQHPLSPLHPNIRMHILHTVLYTFLKVLTRRIC